MRTSHALLLRFRHDPHFDFSRVMVEYLNRGAPSDRSVISGEQILKLEPGWMEVASPTGIVCIPYHRIRRILYEGTTMWELGSGEKKAFCFMTGDLAKVAADCLIPAS